MTRTVNRELIDNWIDEHGPDGLSKLAVYSKVSATTIGTTRRGKVPSKQRTRIKLSRAIGVSEDQLFPLVDGSD